MSIRTDRTDRKSDIRSIKNFLRFVNCISLVELFMARKRRHSLSIQRDNTNCGVVDLLQDVFGKALPRAPPSLVQLLGGGGLKLVRLRCQGKD